MKKYLLTILSALSGVSGILAVDEPIIRLNYADMSALVESLETSATPFEGNPNTIKADEGDCTPLIMAVFLGLTHATSKLLAAGAAVNDSTKDGQTALHGATDLEGKNSEIALEITNMLLDHGANVDAADQRGVTPLMSACYFNNSAVALRLIGAGCDLNRQNSYGETALMQALSNDLIIAQSLINAGALRHLTNNEGLTAFEIATRAGNADLISLLDEQA